MWIEYRTAICALHRPVIVCQLLRHIRQKGTPSAKIAQNRRESESKPVTSQGHTQEETRVQQEIESAYLLLRMSVVCGIGISETEMRYS
jgi:hypothetical protein